MIVTAFLLTSMMAPGAVVLLPPPDAIGVEDTEVLEVTATVSKAVWKIAGAPPLVHDAFPPACVDDAACIQARIRAERADGLLLLSIIRSGDALDVRERLWLADGLLVVDAHRTATLTDFTAAPLSADTIEALQRLPGTASHTPPATNVPLGPALAVTAAGGGLAVLGGAALALSAAVVGDPASAGTDKEAAYVVGWSGIVVGLVGVAGTIAGGAWTLVMLSSSDEDGA